MQKESGRQVGPGRGRLSEEECEQLIARYTPLVSTIARSLLRKLPPSVEVDDLIQDGYVGLLVAVIQSVTVQAGKSYHAYLSQRIRGAMIDGLRENDPGSRRIRQGMRRVEVAINRLSQELGRMPQESEVAQMLDLPLADYQRLLQEADGYTLLSLDDFEDADPQRDFMAWCASTSANPLAALERKAVQRTLLRALSELSEREAAVMQAYYDEELTMREIAVRLDLSQGRVSQLHTQAIAKLRAALLGEESRATLLKPRWRLP